MKLVRLFMILIFNLTVYFQALGQCYKLNKEIISPAATKLFEKDQRKFIDLVSKRLMENASNNIPAIITIKRFLVHATPFSLNTISEQDWQERLSLLNQSLFNTGLQFEYDPIISDITNIFYYDFDLNSGDNALFGNDLPNKLNVYIVNTITDVLNSYGGYATGGIPKFATSYAGNNSIRNNCLITYENMNLCEGKYTLTHEIGHLFGLLHSFEDAFGKELVNGDNKNSSGDFIADTKASDKVLHINHSGSCISPHTNNFLEHDCNGDTYSPDINNIMSYFRGGNRVFTNLQKLKIRQIADDFHGDLIYPTWAKIKNPWYGDVSNEYCDTSTIVTFTAETIKNVGQYEWYFSGGTVVEGDLNSSLVKIKFNQFATFTYKLTVRDINGSNAFETLPQTISINNNLNSAKPLPFAETFENGMPSNSAGWVFDNLFKDCNYYTLKNVGGFGQSNRSICMDNFAGAIGDKDYFLTPEIRITNLQTLKLDFDYAYASKTNNFDTLFLGYVLCNQLIEFGKKGGVQLSTHPPVNNIPFLPSSTDWKNWNSIDLSAVLANPINKTIRIYFAVKSGNGNRLYIDNIRISGQSIAATNSMVATFNRATHKNELTWPDFASDETAYKIERSYSEDGPWNEVASLPENTTSYDELATLSNTVYWYRVKAVSPTLLIPFSNIDSAASCNIPNRPSPLNVSIPPATSRTVNLNWTDNNTNETGYYVFYSFNRYGPYDTLAKPLAPTTSYQHSNTPLGSRIYYFVKAVEVNYVSSPSDTGLVNFAALPASTLSKIEWNIDNINTAWSSIDVSGLYAAERTLNVNMLGYSNGVHTLYVRAADNTGKRSGIYGQTFLRTVGDNGANKVLKFAYYFDADNPAITNPLTAGTLSFDVSGIAGNEFTIPLDIAALNPGLHTLHLRALDQHGNWSNVWNGTFLKLPGGGTKQITKVEYFIDADPGFGAATDVPVNVKAKIDTTLLFGLTGISEGVHTLYLRAKDAQGLWSNVLSKNFVRLQGSSGKAITQIEYYYDTDPGFGSGQHINFPVPRAHADTTVVLNPTSLSDGIHTLYARAKDVKGIWSNVYNKSFLKMPGSGIEAKIVKMEYYIDNDPGLGQANNIDTSGNSNGIYNLNIPITSITDGQHSLYIRAKDNRSLWSIIYSGSFNKVNDIDCPCAKIVYASGTGAAISYQWQVDDGSGNGFQNIADTGVYFGTKSDSLVISNPPTGYAFNKYKCEITTGAGTTVYSSTFVLRYNMRWTGNSDSAWDNSNNWGCYTLPDEKTDVTVPGSKPNYPVLNTDKTVNSIKLNPGSSLQVGPGVKLDVKSRQQ